MIKQVTSKRNLNAAYLQVYRNKGAAGVDEMSIMELHSHLHRHSKRYINQIEQGSYQISPILGVELSEANHEYQ